MVHGRADDQTTLLFLGLPTVTESDVRTSLNFTVPSVQPTQIRSISIVESTRKSNARARLTADCAFVNFVDRATAEKAAEALSAADGIEIGGKRAKIAWGRARKAKAAPAA